MKELTIIKTDNNGYVLTLENKVLCFELMKEEDAELKLACRILWKISEYLDFENDSEDKKILIAMVGENFQIPKDA